METRKIAIVTGENNYDNYDYIAANITDWTEIKEEEYKLLCKYLYKVGTNLHILEQKSGQQIVRYVSQAIEMAKEEEKKALAAKEKRRIAAKKAKATREAKERALMEELKAKYESTKSN